MIVCLSVSLCMYSEYYVTYTHTHVYIHVGMYPCVCVCADIEIYRDI